MKNHSVYLALVIILLWPYGSSNAQQLGTKNPGVHTDIPGGAVSGTWRMAGSPYRVNGEITVPNDSTLTIEPGVEVVFMGHHKLNVQGRLLAVGTQKDSIWFVAADTQSGWHGIRFEGTANTNDTSKFLYCVLRNGKANTGSGSDRRGGAMLISQFDKVLVSNCLFDSNVQSGSGDLSFPQAGPAIFIFRASPTISRSTFSRNKGSLGSAICCLGCPNAIISSNVFRENRGVGGPVVAREGGSPIISGNHILDNVSTVAGGGVVVEADASPLIENNLITNNKAMFGGGIFCWDHTRAVIVNNTIADNSASLEGGGMYCWEYSDPILINNILYGNKAGTGSQVSIADTYSRPRFLFCDIQGGKEGFAGAGAGFTERYENNIDADPMFVSAGTGDYRLSSSSPCISAGTDSVEVSGVWFYAPRFCLGGNLRPSPAGTNPDIGACESLLAVASARDVRLSRRVRDTLGITVWVGNPPAHGVNVSAILRSGSRVLIDSVVLKDDGLHGDGASADGLWGFLYVPKKDDTIRVTIRTDDLTAGTTRTLQHLLHVVFTRGALITVDTRPLYVRKLSASTARYDTTFKVSNTGFVADSLTVLVDPWTTVPDSAIDAFPKSFALAPGDSQSVTFRIRPQLLSPQNYLGQLIVLSKSSYGERIFWKIFRFDVLSATGIVNEGEIPAVFALKQNYPNPFNPSTTIRFELPRESHVSLKVFNLLGEDVATLVEGMKRAGSHSAQLDASRLVSGVYFYRLQAGEYVDTKKMVLLR